MLKTARLDLLPLTIEQIELGLTSEAQLSASLGIPLADDLFGGIVQRATRTKLEKMRKSAANARDWMTYWLIVIQSVGSGVGLAGFKGIPDGEGEVEIGYGMDAASRGNGYMTEAVRALLSWAFSHPECLKVNARKVLKENVASQRVLLHAGFRQVTTSADAMDFEVRREDWTAIL